MDLKKGDTLQTLFVSIQHRKLPLFDKGVELLRKDGFEVFLLENMDDNYDNGVVKLSKVLKGKQFDILHFIDNDCFISDTTYIKKTLKDFEESDFGFVSYFENGFGNFYWDYEFPKGGTIAPVPDQTFIDKYPFMKPSWENAMMMFKREAWDQITDYSDMQNYLPELWKKGVKFGVKKHQKRLKYTHKGDGWVHIGNLIPWMYKIEAWEPIEINEITKPRIGYLQKYHGLEGYPDFNKEWEELIK